MSVNRLIEQFHRDNPFTHLPIEVVVLVRKAWSEGYEEAREAGR